MSVIAYRFKDEVMDQGVLERFILNNTIMGIASVQSEAGKESYIATIRIELSKIKDQLAGVTKLLERWKDRDILMYFVNAEVGVKAVQPFDLVFNVDNKASCVAFSLNLKNNDQITKFLMPAVTKLLPKDGDMDQLLKDMQDSAFGESLVKMYEGEEGVTVFMSTSEETPTLIVGPVGVTGEDREWGWATHYYEEEGAAETGEGDVDEGEAALADLLGEEQPELPIEPDKKPAEQPKSKFKVPDRGKPVVVETKKLDVTGTKLEIEHEKFVPKPGMRQREFDKVMLKHMDRPPTDKDFAEYMKGKFFVMVPRTAMASAMTAAAAHTHKPAATDIQQQTAPAEHKGLKRLDELPIMSDETRAEITTILKDPKHAEFMDKDKAKVIDPKAYKDYDKKLASFAEQLGIDNIDMTINWPHSLRVKIGEAENGVEALACMCTWLSYELGMARQKQEQDTSGEVGAIPGVVESKPTQQKKSGFKPPQGLRKAG